MVNEPDEAHPHAQQPPGKKSDPGLNSPATSSPSNEGRRSRTKAVSEKKAHDIQEVFNLNPAAPSTETGSAPKGSASQLEAIASKPPEPQGETPQESEPMRPSNDPQAQSVESRHEFDHYQGAYHGNPTSDQDAHPEQGDAHGHDPVAVEEHADHPADDEAERARRRQRDRERAQAGWQTEDSEGHSGSDSDEPAEVEEEEGGGPVKSFLEHLEDLRWVMIRSLVALLVGMVVCLVAANKVVELLKVPLTEAQKMAGKPETKVMMFQFGTNVWQVPLLTTNIGPIQIGTNMAGVKLVIEPTMVGDKLVMGVTPQPLKQEEVISQNHITLINLGPVSPFSVAAKIALYGGLGLSLPAILYFVGSFILPALKRVEKKYLLRALGIGTVLFCAGVVFCYVFMLGLALNAAVQFSKWMSFGAEQWRAEEYFSFVVKFLLGMGLSFELPVVLLTLVKIGLLDYQRLSAYRAYFIVVNLVISAILTPPDPVSMTLMALPIQLLYEVSVFIAWLSHRKEKRLEAEAAQAD